MRDKSNQHGCNKGNDMRGMDFRDIEQCFLKRSLVGFFSNSKYIFCDGPRYGQQRQYAVFYFKWAAAVPLIQY